MLKEIATERLIAQLFDNQPDAVVWYTPVFDGTDKIIDFEIRYCNQSAGALLRVDRTPVTGTPLLCSTILGEETTHTIFQQCLSVWNAGEPMNYSYYNQSLDRYFTVQRRKVEGGILSIKQDQTDSIKAEITRQEQEKMYQQILDTTADGIMLLKSVRDRTGTIIDFSIAHCNKKGIEWGRFPADVTGKTILQLLPHMRVSDQLSRHKKVVETGEPERFETTFHTAAGEEYGWFIVSLTKLGDGVISTFIDVSEKKLQEQEILAQKNLHKNILDASLSAIYTCEAVKDKEGTIIDFRILQANQRFREQLIDPTMELTGKNLLEEFPATRKTGILEKLIQVESSGQPARFEIHYPREGVDSWYDTSAVKLGKNSVVVTFANITDQKNTLLQLEEQRTLLDNILRHSANGISVTRVFRNEEGKVIDGRTILANDAAVNFAGIPRELYLGKSAVELDPGIIDSPYYQLCLITLETGEPQFTQYFLDFSKRWLEISISRLNHDHIITIFTDVTPAKETQLQLENSLSELKRSNESLEEFTRAASHDLKEPIRKVQFFVERLKSKLEARLDEEEKSMMERMENAAARMKLLVDDLLEYAHINQTAEREDIDLNKKLQIVLSDLELLVSEKRATIEAGLLPVVNGYRRQLQQLFHNLLGNAMKYAKPGVPPVVTVTAKEVSGAGSGLNVSTVDAEKRFHLIEVRDNGIGFEQEYADKIFNVFTRLHGNHEYSGTGVGLAIVRKVVENHKGYIEAESSPGEGAAFRVLLPV
jgi:PAS domain S-box-containing protein